MSGSDSERPAPCQGVAAVPACLNAESDSRGLQQMNRIIGNERGQEAVDWARKRMHLEGPTGKCLTWAMVDEQGEFVAVVVFSDITD